MEQLKWRASTLFPIALLLLAMVSVQAGAAIAKTLFPLVGPIGMVAVRIAFGTLILALVLRPWRAKFKARSWQPLAIYGVSLGVMNMLYYLALSRVPLGIAVALEFTGPLAVAVLASRRMIDFCWIALAAAGLVLLLPIAQAGIDPVGAVLALGAGVCWGLYIVFGQKTGADYGAQGVAIGSVISAVIAVPIGLITAHSALFSAAVILPGIGVAALSTALPYTLEMIALTRMPARTFGVLMSIEPAIGALFGAAYLNERLTFTQWAAIGLIIAASVGTTASAHGAAHAPAPD